MLALLLIVIGGGVWTAGHFEQRTLAAQRQLLMMHFEAPIAEHDAAERMNPFIRSVPAISRWRAHLRRARGESQYWQRDYASLTAPAPANEVEARDAAALLLRANAAYRQIATELTDPAIGERLDAVATMYLDALEHDPLLVDAAYNYEFVVRARATLAGNAGSSPGNRNARPRPRAAPPALTLHGVPGARPVAPHTGEFKIIVPQRPEERRAQPEAGLSGAKVRKG
jgi:hypothetical protein